MSRINPKVPQNAEKVFSGILFDVYQWEQEMFDGSKATFEKLARQDTALVIPVTEDKKIILIKQQQPGRDYYLSLVGGRVEDGEPFEEAIKRELIEETGFTSENVILFEREVPFVKIDWEIQIFIAKNCHKTQEQQLDAGERIELMFVTFDELVDLVIKDELHGERQLTSEILKAKISPEKMAVLKKKLFE